MRNRDEYKPFKFDPPKDYPVLRDVKRTPTDADRADTIGEAIGAVALLCGVLLLIWLIAPALGFVS